MRSKINAAHFKTYKQEGEQNQKLVFNKTKNNPQHVTKLIREKKGGRNGRTDQSGDGRST